MNKDTLRYFAGICCTLFCNVLMVVGNYVMKGKFKLPAVSSADVTLFKGVFQIPIFVIVILYSMRRERKSVVITNPESELEKLNGAVGDNTKPKDEIVKEIRFIPSRRKDKAWTLSYGIFNGARFAAFYAAVLFMPMADYIVCIATTPIFSYVFSCLLIKTKFTILKSVLCFAVIIGISLVMQPPFLFGYDDVAINKNISIDVINASTASIVTNNTLLLPNDVDTIINNETKFTSSYWIGVGLAFTFAITGAMCNVIPVKCKRVSTHTLMFWAGLGNVVFSFLCIPLPKVNLDTVFDPFNLELIQWITVMVLGSLAVVINQLLIYANILSSPPVNSMTRRSEILLVLFIDMLCFGIYPDAIKGVGYAIVLGSVIGMATANDIQKWIDNKFKKQRPNKQAFNAVNT